MRVTRNSLVNTVCKYQQAELARSIVYLMVLLVAVE
jgi:hypothetical protein